VVYTIFPSHLHEEVPDGGLSVSTTKYVFDKYTIQYNTINKYTIQYNKYTIQYNKYNKYTIQLLLTLKLRSKLVLLYLKYADFLQNFSATFEEKRRSDIQV
jgi:hypothetical protein